MKTRYVLLRELDQKHSDINCIKGLHAHEKEELETEIQKLAEERNSLKLKLLAANNKVEDLEKRNFELSAQLLADKPKTKRRYFVSYTVHKTGTTKGSINHDVLFNGCCDITTDRADFDLDGIRGQVQDELFSQHNQFTKGLNKLVIQSLSYLGDVERNEDK